MQVNSVNTLTKKLQDGNLASSSDTVGDFEVYLKGILSPDSANNVNEEELFSALISERLKTLKGSELSDKYNTVLESKKSEMKKSDGYVPCEDAAKEALKDLRTNGDITNEEADKIYSESFSAAQLDENKDALYDGLGGDSDSTIALSSLEQALLSARTITEKFDSKEEGAEIRSLDEASNIKQVSAPSVIPPDSGVTEPNTSASDTLSQQATDTSTSTDSNSLSNNVSDNAPALELALNFNKNLLSKNLESNFLASLTKDKKTEL